MDMYPGNTKEELIVMANSLVFPGPIGSHARMNCASVHGIPSQLHSPGAAPWIALHSVALMDTLVQAVKTGANASESLSFAFTSVDGGTTDIAVSKIMGCRPVGISVEIDFQSEDASLKTGIVLGWTCAGGARSATITLRHTDRSPARFVMLFYTDLDGEYVFEPALMGKHHIYDATPALVDYAVTCVLSDVLSKSTTTTLLTSNYFGAAECIAAAILV